MNGVILGGSGDGSGGMVRKKKKKRGEKKEEKRRERKDTHSHCVKKKTRGDPNKNVGGGKARR